ncbi:MFS general substrate transporter [Meredithblackwellia eburnea MCA 4105]
MVIQDGRNQPPRAMVEVPGMFGSATLSTVKSSTLAPAEGILAGARTTGNNTPYPVNSPGGSVTDLGKMEEGSAAGETSEKVTKKKAARVATDLDRFDASAVRPEGGLRSWGVVLGCFMLASCQMGIATVWGVLVEDMHAGYFKDTPLSTLSLVIGLGNFLASVFSLVGGRLGERYGYKKILIFGIVGNFLSLMLASVVPSLPLLFVFFGAGLGIANGLSMPLYMSIPSQHFKKKRGLATGIAVSGSGIGGGISSLIVRGMLPKLKYQHTLQVYASINFVICGIAWFLLEVRIEGGGKKKRWFPQGVWRDGAFYSLLLCLFVGTFGFLSPLYYITTYTVQMHPQLNDGSIVPALPLFISGLGMGFGRIAIGYLADFIGPVNSLFLSYLFGGLFQTAMWPHAKSFGAICAFGFLANFTGACFMSLIPVVSAQLFGVEGLATLTGMSVLVNAPGQFVGPVIGGLVLENTGNSYPALAYYSGSMMLAASIILLYARFTRAPRLIARY